MTVVVHCKRCGKELRAQDRYAGMPTRCPRCQTINQLPAPPSIAVPKKATSAERPGTDRAEQETSPDACKICGKLIRGKAERFTDVHGAVYHLRCYQERVGDVPEDVCRICRKRFLTAKERVKDVVGFHYHRTCYQQELERQKLAASPSSSKTGSSPALEKRAKSSPETKPDRKLPEDDDWDLTPEAGDDWNLDGEVDEGWMRPDPEELELKEEAEAPSPSSLVGKPAAGPPEKPNVSVPGDRSPGKPQPDSSPVQASPPTKAPSPPTARQAPLPASKAPQSSARPAGAKPSRPAHAPAGPAPPSATSKGPAGAPSSQPSKGAGDSNAAGPPAPSGTAAGKPETPRKSKPLRRAKPIKERPSPTVTLPDGLELLPDKPVKLPDGLELLPDKPVKLPDGLELLPGPAQTEVVEGLELLDDGPAIPTAKTVAGPVASASPVPTATIVHSDGSLLGGAGTLDELVPVAAPYQPSQGDPFAPVLAAASSFDSPDLADPAAMGPARRRTDNSIPKWLWVVMGLGVGVVVLMLVASVVSVMLESGNRNEPVARSESPESDYGETSPWKDDEESPDEDWRSAGPSNGSAESEVPPDSKLAQYRKWRQKIREMDEGDFAGMVFFFVVFFVIGLSISALALRVACSMCGETDVAVGKILLMLVIQAVAGTSLGLMTSGLDALSALIVDNLLGFTVWVTIIHFALPTSVLRAIGIAILHFVMTLVIVFVVVFTMLIVLVVLFR